MFVGAGVGALVGIYAAYPVADLVGVTGYEGPAYFMVPFTILCFMVGAASGGLSAGLFVSRKPT